MKNIDQYTDAAIIEKVVSGEIALFEILIRRNNSALYKIGRSYNYNHQDTQDLMQETFINAYTSLSKFGNRSSFKTWLIKIMLNNCYQHQRRAGTKREAGNEILENSIPMFSNQLQSDTARKVMNKELSNIIEDALLQVPIDYRLVFSLREMNGLSVNETAELLGITETNVKVRLNRVKTMLRKEIEKSYRHEEIFEFNLVFCDEIVEKVMSRIRNL